MKMRRNHTRVGVSILVIMALVLLAAWNTGTNLFYIVFGGLASFYVISRIMARALLRNIHVERSSANAVHRGDPFAVSVRIENRKSLLPAMALSVAQEEAPDEVKGFAMIVPPKRAAIVNFKHTFDRRGVYELPPTVVSSAFPFGLINCSAVVSGGKEVTVYPRVRAIRSVRLDQQSGAGYVPRNSVADGDEFFSLREYIRGDDIRRIAWRQSARLGTLLVRELEQETSRYVLFAFDTRIEQFDELADKAFEESVETIASLATTLLNRNYRVALQTPTHHLEEDTGKGHTIRMLDFLARVDPIIGDAPHDFEFVAAHDARRCTQVLVSASPDRWGVQTRHGGPKVLHPKDVVHA